MSDLFNQSNLELTSQPFQLNDGGPHATITLAAQLRCLKKPKPKPVEVQKPITIDQIDLPKKLGTEKSVEPTLPAPVAASEVVLPGEAGNGRKYEQMRSPSLDEMVANTLEPMVKTTGNDIDLTRDLYLKTFCHNLLCKGDFLN